MAKRPPPMSNQYGGKQPQPGPSSAPAYIPGPLPARPPPQFFPPPFQPQPQQQKKMMPLPGQQFVRPGGPLRLPPQMNPMHQAATEKVVDPKRAFKQLPTPNRSLSQRNRAPPTWDDDSEGSGTANEDGPIGRAGPAGPRPPVNPNVPDRSYALLDDKGIRTNSGNTSFVMAILSEMWILNLIVLCGGTYAMTFLLPISYTGYVDDELWNFSCWWKIGNIY